jgi:hypothetical protein
MATVSRRVLPLSKPASVPFESHIDDIADTSGPQGNGESLVEDGPEVMH